MNDSWKETMCSQYGLENITLIAEGGMGRIYKAWDKNLKRNVAIKTMPNQVENPAEAQERFQREMRILSRLDHRGIVSVYHGSPVIIGSTNENPNWYVMEYIDGKSLADHIEDRRQFGETFTFNEIILVLAPIAHALDYIHSLNPPLFHRDIKPRNIVVSVKDPKNLKAKIVDFGVAIDTEITRVTDVGLLVGTEKYLAPELFNPIEDKGEVSLSAIIKEKAMIDNYSLALTAYEMLTLSNYADHLTQEQWRRARPTPLLDGNSLSHRSKEERENIIYAIYHALNSDMDKRPATALEFVEMLRGAPQYKEKKEQWFAEKFGEERNNELRKKRIIRTSLMALVVLILFLSVFYFISNINIDFGMES